LPIRWRSTSSTRSWISSATAVSGKGCTPRRGHAPETFRATGYS
jgi:hypothetical protein